MSQRTRSSSSSQAVEDRPPTIVTASINSNVPVSAASVSSVETVGSVSGRSTASSAQVSPDKSSMMRHHFNISKAGWLEKLGHHSASGTRARVASVLTKRWKQRFFVLSDRVLYYYKRVPNEFGSPSKYPQPASSLANDSIMEEDGSSPVKSVDTTSPVAVKPAFATSAKAKIDLTRYHSVVQDLDSFPGKFCLRIMSLGADKTMCLACANGDDMKQWIDAVRPCLSDEKEAQKNAIAWVDKQQSDVESLASNSTRRSRMSPLKFFSRMRKSESVGKTSLSSAASTMNGVESSEDSLDYSTAGHSRSTSDVGVPAKPVFPSATNTSSPTDKTSTLKLRKNSDKRSESSSPSKANGTKAVSKNRSKKWSVVLFLISIAVVIVAVYKFSAELTF